MSSILEGADKAYLREYNASEDERHLDALQDSLGSIRQATKGGKYLGDDVIQIMVEIQGFADTLGIDEEDLNYAEDKVREAQNNLESAIYGLEEPFTDMINTLQSRIDDARMDAEDDLEEGQRCWKGYEKKGTKKMFGKTVNNCVKKESADFVQNSMTNAKPDNKLAKDVESAMSEAMDIPDQNAFDNIFKDRKNKPRKPKYYDNHPTKRSPQPYDKGPEDKQNKSSMSKIMDKPTHGYNFEDSKKKSSMGKVMEMYDDILYLMYIDGELAMPTPVEKKDMNRLERIIKKVLPGSDIQFKGTPRHYYSAEELAEGSGKIRAGLAGIILLGGLLGLNNHQAQKIYDQSHQLQQLTQVYMVAKERGDEAKMKDVKRRIGNHKMRLDLGKGDVDFDGRPGDDDIKDIDYINPIEER